MTIDRFVRENKSAEVIWDTAGARKCVWVRLIINAVDMSTDWNQWPIYMMMGGAINATNYIINYVRNHRNHKCKSGLCSDNYFSSRQRMNLLLQYPASMTSLPKLHSAANALCGLFKPRPTPIPPVASLALPIQIALYPTSNIISVCLLWSASDRRDYGLCHRSRLWFVSSSLSMY